MLASLLMHDLGLAPEATAAKVVLGAGDNQRLRRWQFENHRLTWAIRARSWEVEEELIALLQPPLNSAANRAHPFHASVAAARAAFRAASRSTA